MSSFPRPVVVLSRCLEQEPCRYNGDIIRSEVVRELEPFVDYITPCPEVQIGLGVPRNPIRAAWHEGVLQLFQPATGQDVTHDMQAFAEEFLSSLGEVDGFLLKSRSPSCGIKDVKYYHDREAKSMVKEKGPGFFGGAVLERFPSKAVEDEGRLLNFTIREHFFTKLFTMARCRGLRQASMKDLVQFQAENKYLLMAYSQKYQKTLGRITANPDKKPYAEVWAEYEKNLGQALHKPARFTSNINVLMHCFGYISDQLSSGEREFFLNSLDQYRRERVPLSVPLHVLRTHAVRFEQEYLLQQTFFQPYPEELMTITDSGKGRSR